MIVEPDRREAGLTRAGLLDLSEAERQNVRRVGAAAAMLAFDHRGQISYASPSVPEQTARRWEAINRGARSWRLDFPVMTDCSGFGTWILWDATRRFNAPDFVNGGNWAWGNTDSMIRHGRAVAPARYSLRILDLVFYGRDSAGNPTHVAVYVGKGKVVSHGSEPGPYLLDFDYREAHSARRYLA